MKQRQKKGFTTVELLVVIAVIAVLAAVLIPVMVTLIDDAKESADEQMTASLNKAIAAETGDIDTMSDALAVAEEYGYGVEKLTPTSEGNLIVWDSQTKYFAVVTEDGEEVYANGDLSDTEYLFTIISDESEIVTSDSAEASSGAETYAARTIVAKAASAPVFSYYLGEGFTHTSDVLTVSAGFDAGENADVSVKLSTGETLSGGIIVNANGGDVTIAAEKAAVKTYGTADSVTVSGGTVSVYGEVVGNLEVSGGTVTTQSSASVGLVYVTGSSAVVTATSGSIGAVASTVGDDNITASTKVVDLDDEDVANMAYFAGGIGTEGSPYQIGTADQFTAIYSGSSDGTVYYRLTDDVDLSESETTTYSNWAKYHVDATEYVSVDGGGKTVTLAAGADLFYYFSYSTLTDMDVYFSTSDDGYSGYQTLCLNGSGSVIDGVDTYGELTMTRNGGIYVIYVRDEANQSGSSFSFTLKNCTNYADVTAEGYNAVWTGYVLGNCDTALTYENCWNAGSFVTEKGAFYLANKSSGTGGSVTMNITDCGNTSAGYLKITDTDSGYYNAYAWATSLSNITCTVTHDGTTYSSYGELPTTKPYNVTVNGSDDLKIELDESGYIVLTPSSSEVSYYVVYVGMRSRLEAGGYRLYYVTQTVQAGDITESTYTTGLRDLSFVDSTYYTGTAECGDVVTVDGTDYYYFELDGCYLADGIQEATQFKVLAYSSDGSLVSSYSASL